jgi:hypothetical protein
LRWFSHILKPTLDLFVNTRLCALGSTFSITIISKRRLYLLIVYTNLTSFPA